MLENVLIDVIVPIAICVVLPVMIVWIVSRTKQKEADRRAEIMLKAIEAGLPLDMDLLKAPKSNCCNSSSIKKELIDKLTGACITSLMGTAFLIMGIFQDSNPDSVIAEFFNPWWIPAGCILLAVGIGLFITYFTGKKMLAKEIEAEEKNLED